ncbi:ABATE domain-containing protein [Streptomyces sp. AV19]|uniref:CGNR zinc finger domain-containing protein n=1 Tax=Streptomyces sp. AV19 TaxID=2793068 RepID=UPI0018FE152E|nr:ABATE domain-containing protein [Streptomyces sp. AV19]MBH1934393.1 ABATE domain-containing protein [Streptomyces sp. AV19]MDG4536243.1 ABATE domain-containing protein [Streptomyces sp. AV19]
MIATATGLLLRSSDGTGFRFDPGALCLELLCTGGPGELARWESLHTPQDLADWLGRSRLGLRPDEVTVTAGELATGRALRDALWRLTRAAVREGRPSPADLAEVNRAAAAPPLAPRITDDGDRAWALPATGGQALSAVARDAVELLTGPFAGRIRECGADNCQLVFVDTSRPGRRRWCSMERCGNRHKVRALRARRDAEERTAR